MKETFQNKEGSQAAFDAQVRSMLSGASVPAPAPREGLFAPATATVGAWGKLGIAVALGVVLWGGLQFVEGDQVNSVQPQASPEQTAHPQVATDQGDIEEAVVTKFNGGEAPNSLDGSAHAEVEIGPEESAPDVQVTSLEKTIETAVSPSSSEISGATPLSSAPPLQTEMVSGKEVEVEAVEMSNPLETTEEAFDSEAETGSKEASPTDVQVPEAISNPEKGEEEEEGPKQPTLTLPLTLPSGGGH